MKTIEEIKKENETLIQVFTINELLIEPIEKIISGLKNSEYGEDGIDFIESKLEAFMNLAAEIFNIKINFGREKFTRINTYTRDKYIEYFTALLDLFKKIRDA
jgi:hypothetical protein